MNQLSKLALALLIIFLTNAAHSKTLYERDAYGNVIQRVECDRQRCKYYDKNGTYLGRKERSGSVIYVYDRHGNKIRTERVGGF